jgi:D-aminopeptidase
MRARELGIRIGRMEPGPHNTITDVPGVRVGHSTLISGDGPLRRGEGPVRTGVTVVIPHDGNVWTEPIFAGAHRLNGNGEMTGLEWIRESGMLAGAIGITNTHSVGVVHDALIEAAVRDLPAGATFWALPVVGETYDGALNDIDGFHVRADHVHDALAAASAGPVAEGNVGGGTGMTCHEFKCGIGTASRRVEVDAHARVVGALVQANYGTRESLRIAGVPVGQHLQQDRPKDKAPAEGDSGSIIIVVATDAPLLPHQLKRVARRASLGLARLGSFAGNGSGDIFVAFSTANEPALAGKPLAQAEFMDNGSMDRLFEATVQATEEAIVNALIAARDMEGEGGRWAKALPQPELVALLKRYGRFSTPR